MIFWRAKEMLEGGSELFRAEAELMSKRLTRMLISSAFLLIIAFLTVVGLLMVTAGTAIALSDRIGWAGSLTIVGGVYLLVCSILYVIYTLRSDVSTSSENPVQSAEDPQKPKAKAEKAKDRLDNAVSADPDTNEEKHHDGLLDGLDSLKDSAIEAGMKNPVALGSAALLVVSLLGPGKTIKMVSRGIAAAGLASTLLDSLGTSPSPESSGRTRKNKTL